MVILRWVALGVVVGLSSTTRAAAPERELSLEDALQLADLRAPAIAVAACHVDVALADVVDAAPWLPADPTLEAGAGARGGGGQDGADVSVALSQTVELFGEADLRRSVARRGVDAVRLDVARTRFEVHLAVHKAFSEALVADAEVVAAEDAVAFAVRLVEVAEARVKAGEASSLTVRLARTAWARAREQALAAHEVQGNARLTLGREVGLANATAIKPRGTLTAPTALPPLSTLAALAVEHRPALATLRAQLDIAHERSALAAREALPKPTFAIGYSAEGVAPSSTQTQQIVAATVSLPLPLFRSNDGARARADAEERVAAAALAGEEAALAGHIAEARARAEAARERVLLFTGEILPGVDETLAQLENAFRLGDLDLAEVMVGREQLVTARRESLLAWRAWFDAVSELEAGVGAEFTAPSASSDAALTSSSARGSP